MKYKCIVPLLSFALVPLLLAAPESAKSAPAAVKVVSYDAGVVLTVDLLKQGKNTEAQAQARKLVSQNHTRYEGHLYLGITYFNQSDYNAAEAELNQALSLAPQPFKADVQQALTLTINTRTHDSSLAEAQRALADGLKSKAAKLFAEAANSLPSDTATALKAAQLEYDQGSFLDAADLAAAGRAGTDNADSKAQAQALLDKWHSNYSTAADIRYRQALELAKQGKFEAALPSLEKAAPLLTRPQDGDIMLWLAYYSAGKADESLHYLKAWIKVPGAQFDDISNVDGIGILGQALKRARSNTAHVRLLADAFGDKATTAVLWLKLVTLPVPTGGCVAAAFSPDGHYIVTGSIILHDEDNAGKIWDVSTGKEVRSLTGERDIVSKASFSPDGHYIVTVNSHTTEIWDVSTGKEVRTLTSDASFLPADASFSPKGRYIVTADGWKDTARIWDVSTGNEVHTLTGHTSCVFTASFSPDGHYVVTSSGDKTAKIWDVSTGKEVRTLTGDGYSGNGAAFSPDGRYIVTGGHQTAKIWDVSTGEEVRTLTGDGYSVNEAAFSPDGRYIVTGGQTAKIWDVSTGEEVRTLTRDEYPSPVNGASLVSGASFSPDGHYIVIVRLRDPVEVWERIGP